MVLSCAAGAATWSVEPETGVEVFRARRDALLAAMDDGVLMLDGGVASDDPRVSFRQVSDFYYLTGVEEPGAALVLVKKGEDRSATLFLPRRRHAAEKWTGPRLSSGGLDPASGEPDVDRVQAMERTGFSVVLSTDELAAALQREVARAKRFYAAPEPVPMDAPLGLAGTRVRALRDRFPSLEVADLRPLVARLRLVKDRHELALLQKAVDITCASLQDTLATLAPGQWEFEVGAHVEYGFRRRGAARAAFPSVVASGPNSCVLHYGDGTRRLEAGDLVVLDVGAEYGMYAADVTRTVPVGGKWSDRQREVYRAVRRAQDAALAKVKPGAKLRQDVHAAAVKSLAKDGLDAHFLHSTSHYLGLDVHDVSLPDVTLAAGMVITVEPGVYLPQESIGIRIEDDVLVTEEGHRILSSCIPREAEEIEALLAPDRAAP